jgi:hypothetical protein
MVVLLCTKTCIFRVYCECISFIGANRIAKNVVLIDEKNGVH